MDQEQTRICSRCGQEKPITNFNCKGIRITADGQKKRYRDTQCRKCVRGERVASGLCATCGRQAKNGSSQCHYCLAITNKSAKKRMRLDRQAAFEHYGELCAICGTTINIFLTIDHINNNGATHRKQKAGKNGGHNIYAWLRKNNYPEGFQTLCFNCNCAKSIY